jgi:hypothetical protein
LIKDLSLPLTPYLIYPTVFILLGNRLLFDKMECPPQPFSMNVKFDEHIKYGHFRLSQLPLETRIGINFTVVGGNGEMVVIGCT